MKNLLVILLAVILIQSCTAHRLEKKGFQVNEITEGEEGEKIVGLKIDSLNLETRPRNVLQTKYANHRLSPIYKVNYNLKTGVPFAGSNSFQRSWGNNSDGNVWNRNFMPGLEAVYGYNFINISHFDRNTKLQNEFFEQPVLIKTFYFPAFSNDTLNHLPVNRDYYMVSVYDEDTNKDGFITVKDLRRLYLFNLNGKFVAPLIPKDYFVMNSEYDSPNDIMYVFAKKDANDNGQMEQEEPTHIFWIDLKNPENNGVQYQNK